MFSERHGNYDKCYNTASFLFIKLYQKNIVKVKKKIPGTVILKLIFFSHNLQIIPVYDN